MLPRRSIVFFIVLSCIGFSTGKTQVIKSILYDFDGFDIGSTDVPEGDYNYGDLQYQVTANPAAASEVLGDRVLQLNLNWSAGYGAFGRGISRYLELSQQKDRLNFYFYNPASNGQAAEIEIAISDDDNNSKAYETANDDSWRTTISIPASPSWQLITVPLTNFSDQNSGGNGVFDISFSQNKGMLLVVEFRFNKPAGVTVNPVFHIDMICFTDGAMPQGTSALTPPSKQETDYCLLGAHQYETPGQFYLIPQHFQGMFTPATKKLRYVNTYMQWATNGGTTPHMLPGSGYQTLLTNGYRPVITWEPMFSGFGPTDPAQPNLSKIINGDYDQYLDDFGDQLKTYSDTVIVRLMHEFDGDWYPWCVSTNQNDPQKFVNAFRHIVDRVRNRGADKVKWMWCPNSDFTPQESWNWIVSAYPGDGYVDIVGTDVYNAHYPANLPWWRSFRWQAAEVYYYLTTYFPTKPFFLCELACRERTASEPAASQNKAGWFAMMDKDLQSYFRKTRALIFFNETKTQTWAVNTSQSAVQSLQTNVWDDPYYFPALGVSLPEQKEEPYAIYPNPVADVITLRNTDAFTWVVVTDVQGNKTYSGPISKEGKIDVRFWPPGVYFLTLTGEEPHQQVYKFLKQ